MEMRQLRYFVAVGEEQHFGRAARRLRIVQPAISRQIQNLEREIGFELFERLPRSVKITEAGSVFLDAARRAIEEIGHATERAKRVASGQSGTLRIGFVESISWQGIIPDSLRDFRLRQPDAELQLRSMKTIDQIPALHAGSLDAGFGLPIADPEHGLASLQTGLIGQILAVPNGHPLTKKKHVRLKDLIDIPFVLFPRWAIPNAYDQLIAACARGGLKTINVVQHTAVETMMLSLVQCGVGVSFISTAARWRCPPGVTLLPVVDLKITFPYALMWNKDNNSPILAKLIESVRSLIKQKGLANEILGNEGIRLRHNSSQY